ncbi:MAG TPA: SxtJ family membrane protein [Thermoanaerobaculia bacterium]|nr:SxtJ family membrane protein [Thermoanaerobaculia bacterium]
MLEIRRNPSRRELAWFGLAPLVFFAIVGGMVLWRTGAWPVTWTLWGLGAAVGALYYAVPRLRQPIFVGWNTLFYPLGWLLSHAVLALVFYGLVAPVGMLLRLFGHDLMGKEPDPQRASYWVERRPAARPDRYFRQF